MADIANFFYVIYERFTRNLRDSFADIAPEKWIRIVAIVGAYCLLRPYLIKLGGKVQMAQHEKEAAFAEAEREAKEKAKMSPNELRGHAAPSHDESDGSEAEEEGETSSADWGKKARRRQRTVIKKILNAEEKRLRELQEDDEDKDIQEFLTE